LKELKDLSQLTYLDLWGTQVTPAGVKELQAALPKLQIWAPDKADEASAVKAVENRGGKITRDDKLPGKGDKTSEQAKAICEKFTKALFAKDVDAAMKLVATPWFDNYVEKGEGAIRK